MTDSNNSGGMGEVLPCPFCAWIRVIVVDSVTHEVLCTGCGTKLPKEVWNKRTPAPDEQVGALAEVAQKSFEVFEDCVAYHAPDMVGREARETAAKRCAHGLLTRIARHTEELHAALAPFQRENGK